MADEEVFGLIAQGDEAAFTYVYNRFAHTLYVFLLFYLKDADAAKDALQHIFMRIWEKRQEIQIHKSLKNYLYTAAKNYVLNCLRNATSVETYARTVIRDGGGAPPATPEEILERQQLDEILDRAIADLQHDKKRQILTLRRQGLSNREVAQKLDIPENTVKTYYADCVRTLRRRLRNVGPAVVVPLALLTQSLFRLWTMKN